jgi:Glucose inhibited division protein A
MSNIFDIGIIGAGVAGSFAALKIAKDHPSAKTIVFDLGRPPMKRRRQLEGWLGCLPNSDGKLYQTDLSKVADVVGLRRAKSANTWFNSVLSNIGDFKVIKDKGPSVTAEKRLNKSGYKVTLNDYMQLFPKDIHLLSKTIAENIEDNKNVSFSFDNEVRGIYKQKNVFVIVTDDVEYRCKKIILAVGRSGWRWAKEIYSNFGIIENNNVAKFGIRLEVNSPHMKDFNKSNCTMTKGNEIEIGPLSWYGTVIPEDHLDVAISAFRSNENRWKTDKVSFNLIGNIPFPETGFEQTDRIGKLTFVLSNDRIIKERVSTIVAGKSKISIIPEYDWLKTVVEELDIAMPNIVDKAYFHVPTISPMAPKVLLGTNLESEIEGMYIAGESMGVQGILAAGLTGIICADAICK